MNSYYSHLNSGNNNGYNAFLKAKRDYERDFYLKQNAGMQRGIKTATARQASNYDNTFGSY